MQKRENPYTPGAGRKPPNLAGRDGDLENFQALTERLAAGGYERSLIYSGLRGVGKTVLLMELDVLATEAGWATTDVQEVGSQPDFRVTFARMAARLLREMSRKHRIKDHVDRALGVVKAFSIAVPAGVQLKLDVEAATGVADSGDPEQDILLCSCSYVGASGRPPSDRACHCVSWLGGTGGAGFQAWPVRLTRRSIWASSRSGVTTANVQRPKMSISAVNEQQRGMRTTLPAVSTVMGKLSR